MSRLIKVFLTLSILIAIYSTCCFANTYPAKIRTVVLNGPVISFNNFSANPSNLKIGDNSPAYNNLKLSSNDYSLGWNYEDYYLDSNNEAIYSFRYKLIYQNYHLNAETHYPDLTTQDVYLTGEEPAADALFSKIDNKMKMLNFGVDFSYFLTNDLSVSVGPSMAYVITNNITESLVIEDKYRSSMKFRDNYKPVRFTNDYEAVNFDGEPAGSRNFLYFVNFSLNYDFFTGPWCIKPTMGYSLGLNSAIKDLSWNINNFNAGVIFQYALRF